jgi:hypothetical protein
MGRDVSLAAENILLRGVLPLLAVAGFADWLCHRQTDIQHTAGTHESLTHSLMLGTVGIPATMALLWEIDETVIAASIAGAVVHELVVLWDTKYASTRRRVSLTEQHIHSFLEVLPWMSTAMLVALHPDRWRALIGPDGRKGFHLRRKQRPLKPQHLITIFSALTCSLAIPYFEELVRCFRVDHTFLPHSTQ